MVHDGLVTASSSLRIATPFSNNENVGPNFSAGRLTCQPSRNGGVANLKTGGSYRTLMEAQTNKKRKIDYDLKKEKHKIDSNMRAFALHFWSNVTIFLIFVFTNFLFYFQLFEPQESSKNGWLLSQLCSHFSSFFSLESIDFKSVFKTITNSFTQPPFQFKYTGKLDGANDSSVIFHIVCIRLFQYIFFIKTKKRNLRHLKAQSKLSLLFLFHDLLIH